MQTRTSAWIGALALIGLMGCETPILLPTERAWSDEKWGSFEEARQAFDRIVPGRTSMDELRDMGFHPDVMPNIEVQTYMDVYKQFVPNNGISLTDQDPGVQQCIQARSHCQGWRVMPLKVRNKTEGNVLLDMLWFRFKNRITEWNFNGLIVVVDDRVTYTLWNGNPKTEKTIDKIRPLGPLQNPLRLLGL